MGVQTYYFMVNASATQGQPEPFTPKQRPHAFRAAAKLFMSHTSRAKETLEAKGLMVKTTMKGRCLEVPWRSINLKIWKNGRLEVRPSLPEYPLNVPLEAIKLKACHEAGVIFEAFLSETGLRALRDRLGRLAIEITYWENGYPSNQIAQQTMGSGEKVVYAYHKESGKEAIWGDMSLNPFVELETNSARADKEIKLMMQAINDGEIKPYDDEIRTRQDIDKLTSLTASNVNLIAEYAKQIELHLDLMRRLDEKLARELESKPRHRSSSPRVFQRRL